MTYSIYNFIWLFFIYGFLGWATEVAYATWKSRSFVNRGFLSGPICPIYGAGMMAVVLCLTPLEENFIYLFFGAAFLTTGIEFITGFILDQCFGDKWWDYSSQPLNLHGYICLPFSIIWGVACSLLMRIIQPLIQRFIGLFHKKLGWIILTILILVFLTDLCVTLSDLLHLKKQIRLMKEIDDAVKKLSNSVGEGIYEGIMTTIEGFEKAKESATENLEKVHLEQAKHIEELKLQYGRELVRHKHGTSRLMRAFPYFRAGKHKDILDRLKEFRLERNKKEQLKKNNL